MVRLNVPNTVFGNSLNASDNRVTWQHSDWGGGARVQERANNLSELACQLTSSWPLARVSRRSGLHFQARICSIQLVCLIRLIRYPLTPLGVSKCMFWSNSPTLLADSHQKRYSGTMRSQKCPWSIPRSPRRSPRQSKVTPKCPHSVPRPLKGDPK